MAESLNMIEELILAHRQATLHWSNCWDARALAMAAWAKLDADPHTRRQYPDRHEREKLPAIGAASAELRKANKDFETAREALIALDVRIAEARRIQNSEMRARAFGAIGV